MKRDTKIVFTMVSAIPIAIVGAALACSAAIANGAPMWWRSLFRFLCHGRIERSLEVFGVPMPICARCVAIYAGLLAGLLLFWFLPYVTERALRIASIVAVLPLAIDGLTQLAGLRESTNELRIATGLIAGMAFGMWILCAVERNDDAALTTS